MSEVGDASADDCDRMASVESSLDLENSIGDTAPSDAPEPEDVERRGGGVAERNSRAVVELLRLLLCTVGRLRKLDNLFEMVASELTSSMTLVIIVPVLTFRRCERLERWE